MAPVLGAAIPALSAIERIAPPDRDAGEPGPAPEAVKFQQLLHQDFVTYAPGMEYFMLGNGELQAMVQHCPDRSGEKPQSLLGFTIMDAERFARKWSTFLFHPERGLERSMLSVIVAGKGYGVTQERLTAVRWISPGGIPGVEIAWKSEACEVSEKFFTPSAGPMLYRVVTVKNTGSAPAEMKIALGLIPNFALFDEIGPDVKTGTVRAGGFASITLQALDGEVSVSGRYEMAVALGTVDPGAVKEVRFVYSIDPSSRLTDRAAYERSIADTRKYWAEKNTVSMGNETLDHLYGVSRTGLRAMLARSGKRDSGTWMYNMEWVRDDVMVTLGLLQSGMHDEARTILTKIFEKSIGDDGRTIESSRWFGFDYTELDQNGQVLYGTWAYACWTGDLDFVRKNWKKLVLAADFPLHERFRDVESGLMHNKREFWERFDYFGVEDGYELTYQFWVAEGLARAAELAEAIGASEGERWRAASAEITRTILSHPKYRFIEEGHLIKRRTRDGRWQKLMVPPDRSRMPPGSPLATEAESLCEPDSSSVLPILFGMVDPKSDLARETLRDVERLWNQRWKFGGYSRYNVASEPDPPAPWPMAAMFMARAYAEQGNDEKAWQCINWLRTIHGGNSGGWFERYGPSITPPAPPVSIVGWTWAEVAQLCVYHLLGFRPGLKEITICPKLLTGMTSPRGVFRVRNATVELTVGRSSGAASARVDGARVPFKDGRLRIPYPASGKTITIHCEL
jgi:hypothetical protein